MPNTDLESKLGQSQVRQRRNIEPPPPMCSTSAGAMVSGPSTPDYRTWQIVHALTIFRKMQLDSIPFRAKTVATRSQK